MGAIALLMPLFQKVLDLIPDPTQRAQAQQQIIDSLQKMDEAQDLVNQAEAQNQNPFVSGWRPFIGWVCGVAFAYKFVFEPALIFLLVACGSRFDYRTLPVLDWSEMSPVLLGMLGLSGMRTFERINGIDNRKVG